MTLVHRLACVAVAALLPTAASAQSVSFWLAGDPGNITGCMAADPQFTREHTFTVNDGQADITSPGGINTKLKPVQGKPGVYETRYQLGRMNLQVVADLSTTPRSLTVTDQNLGCKWSAKKE
jgi:hypothetical protein